MDRHDDPTRPDPAGHNPTQPGPEEQFDDRLAIPGHAQSIRWHCAPARQPGCLSAQLARLLLDEYTQVGEVVLDVDDDIAFAATAAATRRRHHALAGQHHLTAMSHTAGYIDLILLHWPRPAVNPQWLLRACRSLLGTTGCVVIAVSADTDQRVAHLSALVGAAATAGLRTIRHVAVLAPDAATPVAGSDRAGGPTGSGPANRPGGGRSTSWVTHPHTDLLIFGIETADDE